MAEPRARVRQKGQVFSSEDRKSQKKKKKTKGKQPRTPSTPTFDERTVGSLLVAFGDHPPPLPSTISALDEILTDFIIETCHYAALSASYSRRQKIKADDFKFALRRDEVLLGRVQEQLWREKKLKEDRKMVSTDDDVKAMAAEHTEKDEEEGGEEGGKGGKKTKRGRKKKADEGEGREAKRRKSG